MEFLVNFIKSRIQTKFNRSSLMVLITTLTMITSTSIAQTGTTLSETPSIGDINAVKTPSFPYVAEITGDNVNVRSGPGTNYYSCGSLNRGDKVEVVGEQFGWIRIVPPASCFCWVSMQYISVNLDNPAVGTVTGEGVRVYAGSDSVEPIHSTSELVRLSRGYKIKLLGEEKDDYFKISPPSGAYLWISTQYTKPISSVTTETPAATGTSTAGGETSAVTNPDANAVTPPTFSVEALKLKDFYAIQDKIKAERAKPAEQQNYTEIKKAITELVNNKEAGKAARYAEHVLKQVEGIELALAVGKEIQLQNTQLQLVMNGIDKSREARMSKIEDKGKFVVIGQLQPFNTFGPGHYRIVDDTGKTMCYALPADTAVKMDLSKLIGRKVGLVGVIEPNPQIAGSLVQFTEVVELK